MSPGVRRCGVRSSSQRGRKAPRSTSREGSSFGERALGTHRVCGGERKGERRMATLSVLKFNDPNGADRVLIALQGMQERQTDHPRRRGGGQLA